MDAGTRRAIYNLSRHQETQDRVIAGMLRHIPHLAEQLRKDGLHPELSIILENAHGPRTYKLQRDPS